MRFGSLILLFLVFLTHLTHGKTIYYVDASNKFADWIDGTSWETAYPYLQDALTNADGSLGDEIWVAEGTYKPTDGINRNDGFSDRERSFILREDVAMYGGFLGTELSIETRLGDANKTVLSGEIHQDPRYWSIHVLKGENLDGNISLDGFKIEKGNANGVLNVLTDDQNYTNVFGKGGGIFLWNIDGNLTFRNCTFSENSCLPEIGGGQGSSIYALYSERVGLYEVYGTLTSGKDFLALLQKVSSSQLRASGDYNSEWTLSNYQSFTDAFAAAKTEIRLRRDFMGEDDINYSKIGPLSPEYIPKHRKIPDPRTFIFENCHFVDNNASEPSNPNIWIGVLSGEPDQQLEGELSISGCSTARNLGNSFDFNFDPIGSDGEILNSNFFLNQDQQTIEMNGSVVLENLSFSENSGGSIKTSNYIKAQKVAFTKNNGTAIYAGELEAQNLILHLLNKDGNKTSIVTEGFASLEDSSILECNGSSIVAGGGVTLSSVDLLENTSPAVKSGSDVVLDRVRIWDNNDSAITASGGVTATNSSFLRNGGHSISSASANVTYCLFEDNNGSSVDAGSAYVYDSNFTNNYTSGNGAGVKSADIEILRCIFLNNRAGNAGAAIYLSPVDADIPDFQTYNRPVRHIQNCVFAHNYAGLDGGAISCDSPPPDKDIESFSPSIFTLTPLGREYPYLLMVTNCVFYKNRTTPSGRGGAFSGYGSLVNCTLTENSSFVSGSVYAPPVIRSEKDINNVLASTSLTNCILWQNHNSFYQSTNHGIYNDWHLGNKFLSESISFTTPRYPGDPKASVDGVPVVGNFLEFIQQSYDNNNTTPILAQNWSNQDQLPLALGFSADPLFINPSDPDGPDDLWMTADDGLQLRPDSPALGVGSSDFLSFDGLDLNNDGKINQPIAFDLLGHPRVFGSLDLGAYEARPGQALSGSSPWRTIDWFGTYFDQSSSTGWIFHADTKQWIFLDDDNFDLQGASALLYLPKLGWLWTSRSSFPHLYRYNDQDWLYIDLNRPTPNYYSYKLKQWEDF